MPTQTELLELFQYDEDSGLLYRKTTYGPFKAGAKVGSISAEGYTTTSIRGKGYKAHRIIYTMLYGHIPKGTEIDHIDGNRENNRSDNLRAVTRKENGRNKCTPKTNTSGVIGVHWSAKIAKWKAIIKYNQTMYYLGVFDVFEEAVEARQRAEKQFGFHKNHGRVIN